MLNGLSKTIETVLEWMLIVLMIGLTAVVILAVIYRKLDASLSWYDEVASIMLSWVTYYGAALAALKRKHIGFDSVLLAILMPLRLWVAYAAEVFVIGFFVLLAWAGWEVLQVLEGESLVSLTWVPVQFTQSVIPIGAVLFVICELLSAPGYLRMVATGQSLEHAEIEAEIERQ
ncbi:MAG: TRAP transporter small permease subunit [Rhizobiales bacterium]|nr:TRAP transporter small permease subunit [Hyphomicrobiales bacterium]